jgi:ribosome production factor 2
MAPTNQQAKAARVKLLAGGKQPKARVARYLKSREPKLAEGPRLSLLLKGVRCSNNIGSVDFLKDLRDFPRPQLQIVEPRIMPSSSIRYSRTAVLQGVFVNKK